MTIRPSDLSYRKLRAEDYLSTLDFTQVDGTDPAGLQEFISKEALGYQQERLGITHVFFYGSGPVAFATVSMGDIPVDRMQASEKVASAEDITSYPCLLIGRLGVHKPFRDRNVGRRICDWAVTTARHYSLEIGCRYVMVRAVKESVGFYQKCHFECNPANLSKDKVWMYRRVI